MNNSRVLDFVAFAVAGVMVPVLSAQSPTIDLPLSPDTIGAGSPAFNLKINGTGFVNGSIVEWNRAPLTTTYVSNHQLKAAVPASNIASAGLALITVLSPNGTVSPTIEFEVSRSQPSIAFQNTTLTFAPIGAITADVNKDNKLDVITPENYYLGNGDGTFTLASTWGGIPGYVPWAVTVADFNGDGKLDIAVLGGSEYTNGCTVSILLGNGDGTFQPPENPAMTQYAWPVTIVSGDFNNDGFADVAVLLQYSYTVSIFFGDGHGHLGSENKIAVTTRSISLAVADVNNDGNLDLIVGGDGSGDVSVYIAGGRGDGSFYALGSIAGGRAYDLIVADVNGDGNQDIFLDGDQIYLGDGKGNFTEVTNTGVYGSFLADMNGDQKLDVVSGGQTAVSGTEEYELGVNVAFGNGDGTFQPTTFIPLGPTMLDGFYITGMVFGDFNGDGRIDIGMSADYSPSYLALQSSMELSTANLVFKLQTVDTPSRIETVSITALGGPLSLGAISISGANAADFSFTTGCGTVLPVNKTCPVNVVFTPMAEGMRSATLSIVNASQNFTQTLALSGTGTAIYFSPSALNFGSVTVGQSSSLNLTVANYASYSIQLDEFKFSKSAVGLFSETNNCSTVLAPGASCIATITFTPQSVGAISGSLLVQDDAYKSPQSVNLTGTGQ